MRHLAFAAGLTLVATGASAQDGVLTVYAPDYFTSEWGPGPAIEQAFEAECGCDLVYAPGDIMPRLMLEGERTEADVVIGLFNDQIVRARESGLFAPHGQDNGQLDLPVDWEDDTFLPFDWSYLAFVYDATVIDTPPTSFEALADMPEDVKLVIQDPRSSEAGLALLYWIKAVYGDDAGAYWERLAPHILTVAGGWSEAYGLFTDGEVPMVLSYTTSPAYHIVAEEDETRKAAIFEEGHYPYFELAAKVAGTDNPELAEQFMGFVLSDTFQSLIPTTNWSYPAAQPVEDWPEVFRDLPRPDSAVYLGEEKAEALREDAIEEWRQALSR